MTIFKLFHSANKLHYHTMLIWAALD